MKRRKIAEESLIVCLFYKQKPESGMNIFISCVDHSFPVLKINFDVFGKDEKLLSKIFSYKRKEFYFHFRYFHFLFQITIFIFPYQVISIGKGVHQI